VAEDFTFAAASAMADDVTGLGFRTCDAVDALTFSSLGHVPAELSVVRGAALATQRCARGSLTSRPARTTRKAFAPGNA
jgi:hypothetical protein